MFVLTQLNAQNVNSLGTMITEAGQSIRWEIWCSLFTQRFLSIRSVLVIDTQQTIIDIDRNCDDSVSINSVGVGAAGDTDAGVRDGLSRRRERLRRRRIQRTFIPSFVDLLRLFELCSLNISISFSQSARARRGDGNSSDDSI